jgi:hypothetical protein
MPALQERLSGAAHSAVEVVMCLTISQASCNIANSCHIDAIYATGQCHNLMIMSCLIFHVQGFKMIF